MLLDMHQAPRCLARTRRGTPCQSPAMKNGRCRMHGETSPGAPKGNKNAYKHGHYTADATARRRLRARLGLWQTALGSPTIGREVVACTSLAHARHPSPLPCMKRQLSLSVATFVGNERHFGLTSSKTDMITLALSIFIQMEPVSWARANK